MRLLVNGHPHELAPELTLAELLEQLTATTRGSAAAVDGAVVPRGQWPTLRLHEGQSVEILTAVQGG